MKTYFLDGKQFDINAQQEFNGSVYAAGDLLKDRNRWGGRIVEVDVPDAPPTAAELKQAANANTRMQILTLESQVTPRTWRETITAPNTINPLTGRTPAQQIVFIDAAIKALIATL